MGSEFPSSSSHHSSIASTSSAECAVCGDEAWSYRHGAAACLGCTVFFRRAIANKTQCRCLKDNKCEILRVFRGACRYCRLQKCLRVGLQPESVNRNGATGIIDKKSHWKASAYENDTNLLKEFVAFQNDQHQKRFQYFADHKVDVAFRKNNRNCITSRRRAQALDISIMLKLGLEEATEFGNQLKPFKKLSEESKKSVLAEYFLAFLFIDQSLKTSKEPDQGMWLLQNESFMHPDYFFGLPEESSAETTVKNIQSRLHFTFVMELLNTVANPFWRLKIDETECVALKILMMLKPSCSKQALYAGREGVISKLFTSCCEELMVHCSKKGSGAERFGELLLLIGSIRCGVKAIYNQMKVSDLFSYENFDDSIKRVLLK